MLPWDPSGKIGPKRPLPDHVSIVEPKNEPNPTSPYSEQKGAKPAPAVPVMGEQLSPAPAQLWVHGKASQVLLLYIFAL